MHLVDDEILQDVMDYRLHASLAEYRIKAWTYTSHSSLDSHVFSSSDGLCFAMRAAPACAGDLARRAFEAGRLHVSKHHHHHHHPLGVLACSARMADEMEEERPLFDEVVVVCMPSEDFSFGARVEVGGASRHDRGGKG